MEQNAEFNPENQEIEQILKDPYECTPTDGFFALLALLVGFLYMDLILTVSALGAGVSIFTGILLFVSFAYIKKNNAKVQKGSNVVLLFLILSSLYFLFFSNAFLGLLNFIFSSLCYIYFVSSALNTRVENCVGNFIAVDIIKHIFSVPFSNFAALAKSIKSLISKSGKAKSFLLLCFGIFAALPLTVLIIALLSSADQAFSDLFETIFGSLWENIPRYISNFIFGIPVSFYIFALLFGCVKKRKTNILTQEEIRTKYQKLKIVPKIAAYGWLITFLSVYTLFYIAQFRYLFSAFNLTLPEEFSYSEYARRGFFELCAIACINLSIVLFAKSFVKCLNDDGKMPNLLKVLNTFLLAYTIGFIIIAISKMFMYINAYGLTPLRIYTSWFMVFLFIVFTLMILRQFNEKLNIVRIIVCVGASMLMILSFANTDALIAKYNVNLYLKGDLQIQISDFSKLSDSAAPYVEQIILKSNDKTAIKKAKAVLREMKNRSENNNWKSFNFASKKAEKIYNKYL
jgi:hypothetical protein